MAHRVLRKSKTNKRGARLWDHVGRGGGQGTDGGTMNVFECIWARINVRMGTFTCTEY